LFILLSFDVNKRIVYFAYSRKLIKSIKTIKPFVNQFIFPAVIPLYDPFQT